MTIILCFKNVESDNLDSCFTWTIKTLKLQVFPKEEELIFCGVACKRKLSELPEGFKMCLALLISDSVYKSKVELKSKTMTWLTK